MKGIRKCEQCASWSKLRKRCKKKECPLPEVVAVKPDIRNWSAADFENKTIASFPIKDLLVLAQMLRAQNIGNDDVRDFARAVCDGYMAGYAQAKKDWDNGIAEIIREAEQ